MSGMMLNFAGVTATSVPGAPTIGTASVSVLTASVPFTAPVSNGGSPITSYTATSSPSGITGTLSQAGSGTITVSGLAANTAYTFTVTATNAIGTGPASAASNSVTTANVPGAPTIGTATILFTTASVPFTAPASDGGSAITTYTATSTPGNVTGTLSQAGSGTVTVSGLTGGTSYTFKVKATNAIGTGAESAASNSVTAVAAGQQVFTTPGSTSWVAPAGVTSVSVVVVGAGGRGSAGCSCASGIGGSGGALAYVNNYAVIPGNSYNAVVSSTGNSASTFDNTAVSAGSGKGLACGGGFPLGGTVLIGTGGNGGNAGCNGGGGGGGGGGAGGYSGNGGGRNTAGTGGAGGGASRGAASGGGGGGGGGVGLLGQGANGAGGAFPCSGGGTPGGGGSGGESGTFGGAVNGSLGGLYGGGSGGGSYTNPGAAARPGAVRIIWPGTTRQFPSTNTGDV